MNAKKPILEGYLPEFNTGIDYEWAKNVARDEKGHQVAFAKELLKEVEGIKRNGLDFAHISFPLGLMPDGEQLAEAWLLDAYEDFLKNSQQEKVIQNLLVKNKEVVHDEEFGVYFEVYMAEFDIRPIDFVDYLKNFIEGYPHKILVCADPEYGFYKDGDRDNVYQITKKHKRFRFVFSLVNKKKLSASEIVRAVKYTRSNKVADECRGINQQFEKKCGILFDLIVHLPDGQYAINERIKIKLEENP